MPDFIKDLERSDTRSKTSIGKRSRDFYVKKKPLPTYGYIRKSIENSVSKSYLHTRGSVINNNQEVEAA